MFFKKRFDATFKQECAEVNGECYTIRELSLGERSAFFSYHAENEGNPLLACAWLLSKACAEFTNVKVTDISLKVGPSTIDELSAAIIKLSGLDASEAIEQEAKN